MDRRLEEIYGIGKKKTSKKEKKLPHDKYVQDMLAGVDKREEEKKKRMLDEMSRFL